jgi:hypothetical protein
LTYSHEFIHVCKDLIAKISHYNEGMRRDALVGLKGLFELHPGLMASSATLMTVFERVALLISDPASQVRHALLLLMRVLVPGAGAVRVAPFSQLLIAHTCMGMTKLDQSIRQNALEFVDIWLQHMPALVVAQAPSLLRNLLSLISTERSGGSGAGRSLIVNPQSRLAQQKARMAVMQRFLALAQLLHTHSARLMVAQHDSHAHVSWMDGATQALAVYPSRRYAGSRACVHVTQPVQHASPRRHSAGDHRPAD